MAYTPVYDSMHKLLPYAFFQIVSKKAASGKNAPLKCHLR